MKSPNLNVDNLVAKSVKLAEMNHITPMQNYLLANLPKPEFDILANHLDLVKLSLGDTLYRPSLVIKYAYFPISCVVSLHCVTDTGASAETASVGNEGMVGVSIIMGGESMASYATVLISGYAFRIESSILKNAFQKSAYLQQLLLKYIQMLYTQTSQTAVCNRHHTIQQQLAKWLLLTTERVRTQELVVTQELISGLLGVRRESITQAAINLQDFGLINYRRGHISVLDSEGLKAHTCECYKVLQTELIRLLPI